MSWIDNSDSSIGTVVGATSTDSYAFILRSYQAKVGDIVATKTEVPHDGGTRQFVLVWGRIVSIERHNPFFPAEAAQELAEENVRLIDTVLSNSRDYLHAEVLILGSTTINEAEKLDISPLTYPVQPAARVLTPPARVVEKLLGSTEKDIARLRIGSLLGRSDVEVALTAAKVVSRHMAILAMTGGGKTVASRRILLELIDHSYPLIIFDPHGDYLGLYENRDKLPKGTEVKLFYPMIQVSEENQSIVGDLITKMGRRLSEAQQDYFNKITSEAKIDRDTSAADYIRSLIERCEATAKKLGNKETEEEGAKKFSAMTVNAVKRSLSFILHNLSQMEKNNERLRDQLKDAFDFTRMSDPKRDPDDLVRKGQVSIFYLAGYDHLTQSTIVSIVLEALFEHRANLSRRIPPFLAVLEEAHNFIPSRSEGQDETPSLATVRKVITEGRKFGTGLLIISQRPARLDETILAQCNSFLVLRLVNPKDKNFVRSVMENLSETDANVLQTFGPGQGIVSGQAVRFPLLVRIQHDKQFESKRIGDEDFIKDVASWEDNPRRTSNKGAFSKPQTSSKPEPATTESKEAEPHDGQSKQPQKKPGKATATGKAPKKSPPTGIFAFKPVERKRQ
jgi:DNA helicase HerA-like ATPase